MLPGSQLLPVALGSQVVRIRIRDQTTQRNQAEVYIKKKKYKSTDEVRNSGDNLTLKKGGRYC